MVNKKVAFVKGLFALAFVGILMGCSGLIVSRHYGTLDSCARDVSDLRRAYANMRSGSEILSLHVTRYVMTGSIAERDAYFREAKQSKHREEAFHLLSNVRGSAEVENHLRTAMNLSMELMQMEYHAMRLMIDDEELKSAPPEIQGCRLTDEELIVTAEERRRRACSEVLGDGYFSFKFRIYAALDDAIEGVILYAETRAVRGWAKMVTFDVLIGLALLVMGGLFGRWMMARQIGRNA